jgi:hypothetical protein
MPRDRPGHALCGADVSTRPDVSCGSRELTSKGGRRCTGKRPGRSGKCRCPPGPLLLRSTFASQALAVDVSVFRVGAAPPRSERNASFAGTFEPSSAHVAEPLRARGSVRSGVIRQIRVQLAADRELPRSCDPDTSHLAVCRRERRMPPRRSSSEPRVKRTPRPGWWLDPIPGWGARAAPDRRLRLGQLRRCPSPVTPTGAKQRDNGG